MITLVTNPFQHSNPIRNQELVTTMAINSNSPYVSRMILCPEKRATYSQMLQSAQAVRPDEIVCIANNDITFADESLKWCKEIKHGECYALTRWETKLQPDGSVMVIEGGGGGQDAWVFRGPPPLMPEADFELGRPDCDVWFRTYLRKRLKVSNPSKSIKIWHHHPSEIRDHSQAKVCGDGIPDGYLPMTYLEADPEGKKS